jgi:hypothetical protein
VLNCQAVINLFKTCGWYEKVLFPRIVKIVAVVCFPKGKVTIAERPHSQPVVSGEIQEPTGGPGPVVGQ